MNMPNPLKSIAQVPPDQCYGCGACMNACSAKAIFMEPDGAGFLRPVIDGGLCVDCGACANACPRLHPVYANESPDKCLAVMASDNIRRKSSSGGVFTLLAEHVLAKGGVVFGAAFTDDSLVRHVAVGSVGGLDALRGSKYAQSDTGTTYAEAKRLLDAGRPVLYSGCPCQIAGLRSFLGRDYSNLLTVDILCSGTPSAYGLREYLDKTWGLENVASMRFRSLEGWDYRFEVRLKSGDVVLEKDSPYLKMFLRHALNRPSCCDCRFQVLPRQGDFTMGDFWNVRTLDPALDDGLGTSVLLLNSKNAKAAWEAACAGRLKASREFPVRAAYDSGVTYLLQGPAPYARQEEFDRLVRERGFSMAVRDAVNHYDVGIAATWFPNFGTIATNLALYSLIRSCGLTACVLDVTGDEWLDGQSPIPRAVLDSKGIPRASTFCDKGDYGALNDHCDRFVVGSDQLWGNIPTYLDHEEFLHLGFADPGKPLIAVGTSTGASVLPFDAARVARRKDWLSRFSGIGLREDFGPELFRKLYHVDAGHIQDPVFLCDREVFLEEAKHATFDTPGKFVFAYILYKSPDSPEFSMARRLAKAMDCNLIVNRGVGTDFEVYDAGFNLIGRHPGYLRNWMLCMANASLVFTNSFHGVCIPLIFGKDFAAVKNNEPERLEVLAREFGCGDRIFDSLDQVDVRRVTTTHMDHDRILRLVDAERARGRQAVREMLAAPAKPAVKAAPPVYDDKPPEDPRALARFRAGIQREQLRCRDSKYLEYLSKIGRPDLSSTILVQIAAYKDPEVVNTVKAALAMAANADRLRFAVCLQDDDAGKLEELLALPNVRVRHFPSSDAPGTCAARYYAQELYDGEDFSFHTDSHMRFARFWDVSMVEQWRLCGNEKAILTEYGMNLDPGWLDRPVDDPRFTAAAMCHGVVTSAFFFSNNRPELRFRGHKTFVADRPRLGAFMCAHDMFCRGEVDRLVRFDRFMDFAGDEGAMSARLWTHGYDIYHPCVRTVFHLYERSGIYKSGSTLPDSQKAMVDGGISRWERQNRRMEKLFGMCDRADVDLSGFDLGFERTLADYEAFCGVDFRRLAIRAFAAGGFFDVPHGAEDMVFVDWQQAYLDLYKAPVADVGRALDVPVRQEVADAFMAFCAGRHWQPQAALTEALRAWLGRF